MSPFPIVFVKLHSHWLCRLEPKRMKSLCKCTQAGTSGFRVWNACDHTQLRRVLSTVAGSTYKSGVYWSRAESSTGWTFISWFFQSTHLTAAMWPIGDSDLIVKVCVVSFSKHGGTNVENMITKQILIIAFCAWLD